jgi:predicted MPP superfamily phosphohydrolase
MSADRIRGIVDVTNALSADVIVLLGDYGAGHRWVTSWVESKDWAEALSGLRAPLGVHAVLGNHDWWEDRTAQKRGTGPVFGRLALERVGILVYENDVVRLQKDGQAFWLAGLGDQIALLPGRRWGRKHWQGVDDLPLTLSKVTDEAPVILLAHEPDIFPKVPDRVALTLCGHTHGGQVRILGHSPIVPSRYGNRYAYGHIVEPTRDSDLPGHMIVSGGLGCAIVPVRLGVVPEIVQVDLAPSAKIGRA